MKPVIEPKACKNIGEIREALDIIDMEIIQLFAQRLEYVKEIVKFKSGNDDSIIARERKELVLKQRVEWAEEKKLDPGMMGEIFRLLIEKNIQIQFDINKNKNQ